MAFQSRYFTLFFIFYLSYCQLTTSEDPITPALSKNEMFRDFVIITSSNFTDVVLKSKDPWIVVLHDGNIYKSWKQLAMSLRGIIWMGLINNDESDILSKLHLTKETAPKAVVFHYNYFANPTSKLQTAVHVNTPIEARKSAVSTLPDNTITLNKDEVQDFLIDSFMGHPARFPVIFITDERESPALLKALSLRFSKYFHFGIMYDPDVSDLKALGLEDDHLNLPSLCVLVTPEVHSTMSDKDDVPELSAIFYDDEKMGEMSYVNIMQFFFQINREFRGTLPGENMVEQKNIRMMSDIIEVERLRFQVMDDSNEGTFKDEL